MIKLKQPLWQWGPVDASVLYVYPPAEVNVNQSSKFYEMGVYPRSLFLMKDGVGTWIDNLKELMENSLKLTKKYICREEKRRWLKRKMRNSLKGLDRLYSVLGKTKIGSLKNKEAAELYQEFLARYYYFWAIWAAIEQFNYGLENLLEEELIKRKFAKKELKIILVNLTSTTKLSFYMEETKDLLKLALKRDERGLKEHGQKYFWMLNNYGEVKVLGPDYFKSQRDRIRKKFRPAEIKRRIKEIEEHFLRVREGKERLMKKYKLSSKIKEYGRYLDDFVFRQDVRKKYNLISSYWLNVFAGRAAKKTRLKVEKIEFLTTYEVGEILGGKRLDIESIVRRRKEGVVFDCQEDEVVEYTGKKAQEFFAYYIEKKPEKQIRIIEGTLASVGPIKYFKGPVKIVKSVKELGKVHSGDVLVTGMTSPNYIIGIKKAGAIITDEGGFTCHAAVVSRELNKPCIVGTKIATKILKDGQTVELHTGRGSIKIFSF